VAHAFSKTRFSFEFSFCLLTFYAPRFSADLGGTPLVGGFPRIQKIFDIFSLPFEQSPCPPFLHLPPFSSPPPCVLDVAPAESSLLRAKRSVLPDTPLFPPSFLVFVIMPALRLSAPVQAHSGMKPLVRLFPSPLRPRPTGSDVFDLFRKIWTLAPP